MTNRDDVETGGIFEGDKYRSRTFLEGGNPVMSLLVDADENVKSVLTYEVELGTGKTLWIDAHQLIDQDGDPSNGLQLKAFDGDDVAASGTMTNKAAVDDLGVYEKALFEGRTFMEKDAPILHIAIDRNQDISGVATFQIHPSTGKALWVDDHKLVDNDGYAPNGTQLFEFDGKDILRSGSMISKDAFDALGIYEASKYHGRTFMEEGNPVMRLTIDKDENVSGVETFKIDPATDKLVWIDTHKVQDQNADPDDGIQLMGFDPLADGAMTKKSDVDSLSIYHAGLYHGRTLIEDGHPVMHLAVDRDEKVDSVLTFEVDLGARDVIWFDQHKMVDQDASTANGVTLIDFDSADGGTMKDKASVLALGIFDTYGYENRTFVSDGLPSMRLSIDEDEKVSGVETFEIDPGTGQVVWLDEYLLIDQDGDEDNGIQMIDFDATDVAASGSMISPDAIRDLDIFDENRYMSRTFLEEGHKDGD